MQRGNRDEEKEQAEDHSEFRTSFHDCTSFLAAKG